MQTKQQFNLYGELFPIGDGLKCMSVNKDGLFYGVLSGGTLAEIEHKLNLLNGWC